MGESPFLVATCTLFGVGVALYFVGLASNEHWVMCVGKPIPLLALLLWTIQSKPSCDDDRVTHRMVIVALVFGMAGDMLLEFDHFVPGLIMFLLGHVSYALALSKAAQWVLAPLQLAPLAPFGVVVIALLGPKLGSMLIPVGCYMLVSMLMAWRAGAWAQQKGHWALAAPNGAMLFMFSDSLIAINKFLGPFKGEEAAVMFTYWVAQVLITASILLETSVARDSCSRLLSKQESLMTHKAAGESQLPVVVT